MARISEELSASFNKIKEEIIGTVKKLNEAATAKISVIRQTREELREVVNEEKAIATGLYSLANSIYSFAADIMDNVEYEANVLTTLDDIDKDEDDEDDEEDEEDRVIGYCDYCGDAIYENDDYIDNENGLFCCDSCACNAEEDEIYEEEEEDEE